MASSGCASKSSPGKFYFELPIFFQNIRRFFVCRNIEKLVGESSLE
jgi:hypothetical protein